MIGGVHVKHGTRRRLAYDAWYERVGTRLVITAALRYGERTLATLDLEAPYDAALGTEEEVVAAVLAHYIDQTRFDFGVAPAPAAPPAAHEPAPSARSAWAELRAGDWGHAASA